MSFSISQQCQDAINKICLRPRAKKNEPNIAGCELIGRGFTSDVWKLGEEEIVAKIYRLAAAGNLPVQPLMRNELETYKLLAQSAFPSPLPALYANREIPTEAQEGDVCGWAVFSRLPGQPLTFDELRNLPNKKRNNWICSLVDETVKIEKALDGVTNPPSFWNAKYADVRIDRILNAMPDLSKVDRDITEHLGSLIYKNTDPDAACYIHGDLNPPNIVSKDGKLGIIDPLINFDSPAEANFRHLTFVPGLAEACAKKYDQMNGYESNPTLLFSIGALTHHFMYLVNRGKDPAEAMRRVSARNLCLSKLDRL